MMKRRRASGDFAPIVIGAGAAYGSSADSTSYTATVPPLPSIGASERAVIGIAGRATGPVAPTVTAVTIGGQACVQLHSHTSASRHVDLWLGPVGASGNVAVTLSATTLRLGVTVWPVSGIQSATPTDTAEDIDDPLNANIDCQAGGAVFGVSFAGAGSTWTGITEDTDALMEDPFRISGASLAFATAQTGLAIQSLAGDGFANVMAVVALR